jgi:hypothetical protein
MSPEAPILKKMAGSSYQLASFHQFNNQPRTIFYLSTDYLLYISRIPPSIYKHYIHRNEEQSEQEYKLDMLLLEQVLFEYLLLADKLLLEHR